MFLSNLPPAILLNSILLLVFLIYGCRPEYPQVVSYTGSEITITGDEPYDRFDHSAVVHDTSMYVFGGAYQPSWKYQYSELWEFSFLSSSWTLKIPPGPAPAKRAAHTAVVYNSKMYIYGGHGDGYDPGVIHEYDFDDDKWAEQLWQGDVPVNRYWHASAVFGNYMYVFGGQLMITPYTETNELWKYDFTVGSWTQVTEAGWVSARWWPLMYVFGSSMYMFYGYSDDFCSGCCSDLWRLDLALESWIEVTVTGDKPSALDGRPGSVVFGNMMHVFRIADTSQNDFWRYEFDIDEWELLSIDGSTPGIRSYHTMVYYDNSFFIFGGWYYENFLGQITYYTRNDVWEISMEIQESTLYCFDIDSNDDGVCGGNGTCISPDLCDCPNYVGSQCQNWRCGEVLNTEESVCSGNGSCISPQECFCGAYLGENCENWKCGDVLATNYSFVCSGFGSCDAPGTCICDGQHFGDNCSQVIPAEDTVADTDAETLAETEAETIADTVAETLADTEAETIADTDAETLADTEAETIADTDAETLADTVVDTDAETLADTEAETIADTETETIADTLSETLVDTNAETLSETLDDTNEETGAETLAETLSDTNVDTDVDTFAETIDDTDADTDAETLSETTDDTNEETSVETIAETLSDTDTDTLVDTIVETIADTDDETGAETLEETITETFSELVLAETFADTASETSVSDTNEDTDSDTESETAANTTFVSNETLSDTATLPGDEDSKCFKKRKTEEGVCSNNGWCVQNDLCYCKRGTYSHDCNRTVKCDGIPSANSEERKACAFDDEQGVCYPIPKNGMNKKLLRLIMRDLDNDDWEDLKEIYGDGNRMFYKYKNPKNWEDLEFDFEMHGVCVCGDQENGYKMCGTHIILRSTAVRLDVVPYNLMFILMVILFLCVFYQ